MKKKFIIKNKVKKFPWKRLLFLIIVLIIYRFGINIPIPGINIIALENFLKKNNNTTGVFSIFSGIVTSHFTIFSLGVMPYISSSIIMQLISLVSKRINLLKKDEEIGRYKITKYTKCLTILLAFIQSLIILFSLSLKNKVILKPGLLFDLNLIVTLVTGTIILIWLGEQITKYGLGNGISVIIFSGIVSKLPNVLINFLTLIISGNINVFFAIFICIVISIIIYLVVLIERGQRRIIINYAKRQIGNKICYIRSNYLPLKLNMSGVVPIIFASSIVLLPSIIINFFVSIIKQKKIIFILKKISFFLLPNKILYLILYSIIIIFFCFFYSNIVFNSKETSENLKRNGAFVPGFRPGLKTSIYIKKVLMRLTLFGSIYVILISLLPQFLTLYLNIPFYFGGTSLLIIIVVTMDFAEQVQGYIISNQYGSLLTNNNIKKNVF